MSEVKNMCPPSHSENAPRESSMAVEASRYVAPPLEFSDLADEAFDRFANRYNHESNEWLDMDVSKVFKAGFAAALSVSNEHPKGEDAQAAEGEACQCGGAAETPNPHLSPDSLTQSEIGGLAKQLRDNARKHSEAVRVVTLARYGENYDWMEPEQTPEWKAADAILTLSRQVEDLTRERDEALTYATRLATIMWQKHYAEESPNWSPLDDLIGILTQIDNMNCGLSRAEAAEQKVEDLTRERDEAVKQERESCAFAAECVSGFGDPWTIETIAANIRARGPEDEKELVHVPRERFEALTASQAQAEALRGALEPLPERLTAVAWACARIGMSAQLEATPSHKEDLLSMRDCLNRLIANINTVLSLPTPARDDLCPPSPNGSSGKSKGSSETRHVAPPEWKQKLGALMASIEEGTECGEFLLDVDWTLARLEEIYRTPSPRSGEPETLGALTAQAEGRSEVTEEGNGA